MHSLHKCSNLHNFLICIHFLICNIFYGVMHAPVSNSLPVFVRHQKVPLWITLLVRPSFRPLVGCLVCPHITLSAFFLAVCRWIDLKFDRDLYFDLLFKFLFFFFFLNSSNSSYSSFSSEIEFVYIFKAHSEIWCLLSFEQISCSWI